MISRRLPESKKDYKLKRRAGLRTDFVDMPAIQQFKYCKVVANEFPYDAIAQVHHMLVPNRKVATMLELDIEEIMEIVKVKEGIGVKYDIIWENPVHEQTVKSHYHIHLIKQKEHDSI